MNEREDKKMEIGYWWEVYTKRLRVDAKRSVISGCVSPKKIQPEEDCLTWAVILCTVYMQPRM